MQFPSITYGMVLYTTAYRQNTNTEKIFVYYASERA